MLLHERLPIEADGISHFRAEKITWLQAIFPAMTATAVLHQMFSTNAFVP
jgi:hypothetical protein